MSSRTFLSVVVSCALACAGVKPEPFVDRAARARSEVGYVAALFSVESEAETFLIGLQDPVGRAVDVSFRDPSAEFALDTTHLANRGLGRTKQIGMIALPPGDYRIAHWRIGDIGPGAFPRRVARSHPMGVPFAVRPGHVVFLGSFTARQTYERTANLLITTTTIQPKPVAADEAWELVTAAYPGFREAPVECLLCEAPRGEPSAAPALRESGGFSRAPDVTIHLLRPAGTAGTCSLVAWERLEGKRGRREVVSASRKQPMPSTQGEHGGVSWSLDALNFRDGQVSFQVRDCTPALKRPIEGTWNLSQGREVWIDEADPKLRFAPGEGQPGR